MSSDNQLTQTNAHIIASRAQIAFYYIVYISLAQASNVNATTG